MNITITLATSSPIPIHPLDMSTYLHNDPSTNTCLGTIQVSDQLGVPGSPADVALGISFLRNVYTVHELDTPVSPGTYSKPPSPPKKKNKIAPHSQPSHSLQLYDPNTKTLHRTSNRPNPGPHRIQQRPRPGPNTLRRTRSHPTHNRIPLRLPGHPLKSRTRRWSLPPLYRTPLHDTMDRPPAPIQCTAEGGVDIAYCV
jgi:hypothetical protein